MENKQHISDNKSDKIDVEQLIKDYSVINVEGFTTYLIGVCKDLAERSDNKYLGINKITFTQYYELPGMISSRLFNVFDKERTEYLSVKSFVEGMLTLFTKGFDELVKFIFKFYDFDNNGEISKEDIRIVLSYVPLNRERFKRRRNSPASVKQKEDFEVRMESQDELHNILESIFDNDESKYGLKGSPTQVEKMFNPIKDDSKTMLNESKGDYATQIKDILKDGKFL